MDYTNYYGKINHTFIFNNDINISDTIDINNNVFTNTTGFYELANSLINEIIAELIDIASVNILLIIQFLIPLLFPVIITLLIPLSIGFIF